MVVFISKKNHLNCLNVYRFLKKLVTLDNFAEGIFIIFHIITILSRDYVFLPNDSVSVMFCNIRAVLHNSLSAQRSAMKQF